MDPVSASVLGTWISKFYKYLGYYQTVTGFLGDDQVKNMLENIGDVHYEAAKKAINNRHYTEARANLYAAQAAHEKIIGSKGQVLGFKVERSDSEKEEIWLMATFGESVRLL